MKNCGCTLLTQVAHYPGRTLRLLLLLGVLLAPPPAAYAQSSATRGTFIIAVATDAPPFAVQADNGQLVGFDLDLIKLLARTAGLRVAYEAAPFIQLIPGVATRLYDAAVGCIVTTEKRKTLVDFSSSYFTTGKVFAFAENSPPIYDLTDLTPESTLSVMAESAAWSFLTEQKITTVVTTTTPDAALKLAAARVTNAAFVDEIATDRFRRAHPEANLRVVSGLVTLDQCAIAVSKENPQLLLELNAAMTRLKNNGKYLTLYRRWFGSRPLTGPPPGSRPVALTDAPAGTAPVAAPTEDPMAAAAMGVYAVTLLTEPSTYQLIELVPNGQWLEYVTGTDAAAMRAVSSLTAGQVPVQQGHWQVASGDPIALTVTISATVPLSPTTAADANADPNARNPSEPDDAAAPTPPIAPRKEYQLTIEDGGGVEGVYTLYTSAAPTATLLVTETIELVGQHVVQ